MANKQLPKLFECCENCKPPKRHPTCHDTCPEFAIDKAFYEVFKEEEKERGTRVISKTAFDEIQCMSHKNHKCYDRYHR